MTAARNFISSLLEQVGPAPTPEDVVGALVPEVVDLAQVFVRIGDELRLVAYRHIDPAHHPVLEELARVHRPRIDHPSDPVALVIRTGEARLNTWIERRDVERATRDARVHAIFDVIRPRNIILVPLARGGEAFGALVVAVSSSSRRLVEADLVLMRSFAEGVGPRLRA